MPRHHDATTEKRRLLIQRSRFRALGWCESTRNRSKPALTQVALDGRPVDGIDEIVITGGSASVRHVSGAPPREVKTSFSAPVPRSPGNVKLLSVNGRGAISIIQEPSPANGYTTIVRIDDSARGGEKLHQFTLRWSLP